MTIYEGTTSIEYVWIELHQGAKNEINPNSNGFGLQTPSSCNTFLSKVQIKASEMIGIKNNQLSVQKKCKNKKDKTSN